MAVALLSYGADSCAMLVAMKELKIPIDRIVTCDIMYDNHIPAELPEIVAWKSKADKTIQELTGVQVEHVSADITFKDFFYTPFPKEPKIIHGFPICTRGKSWCWIELKKKILDRATKGEIVAIGYTAEESARRRDFVKAKSVVFPLQELGWTTTRCHSVAKKNGLLSPVYTERLRGGCWFCPKQDLDSVRRLYHGNKDLFDILEKIDTDAVNAGTFRFCQRATVKQFRKRFELEDAGKVPMDSRFRWRMLDLFEGSGSW